MNTRKNSSLSRLFAACVAAVTMPVMANWSALQVAGIVVDEQNQPIAESTLTIAGKTVETDSKGKFTLALSGSDRYQFSIAAQGYYHKVHDFSHGELNRGDALEFVLVEKQPGRVMFAFGGDVMMGRRYYSPYFDDPVLINEDSILSDSKQILAPIKPYMTLADIAAVNLESQVAESEPSQRAKKSVTFYSRPETVKALQWAGIDYVTLGNNHTYDYLDEGLLSTLQTLDQNQLPYSGAGLTEQDALKPYVYKTDKVDYAMLGYVGWEGSKAIKQAANAKQGGAAFGTEANIVNGVKLANKEKQKAIVQYHGSLEYSNEPTGVTEQRLKSAIDAGAVMAVAHHPHVAQGLELYNNKLIAYSMGNFVFDQNFSSTQLSLVLYVWLDQGHFHRAEIVPVYVKGYKPTPALGIERDTLLKRLTTLSAKRDTHISVQAGHGVIKSQQQTGKQNADAQRVVELSPSQTKVHLIDTQTPGSQLAEVRLPKEIKRYRLGTNLINGSDFEQFDSYNTKERGLAFDPNKVQLHNRGNDSTRSLAVSLQAGETVEIAMKHFRRVYRPDTPVTFKADILTDQDVTVNLYWQGRKTRQKLFDAFDNSPKQAIASINIDAGDAWQGIELDFNAPRIGYRSYRVMAEVVAKSTGKTLALIDNFSLVQWHTAYQQRVKPMTTDDGGNMATYIGFSNTSSQPVKLTLER